MSKFNTIDSVANRPANSRDAHTCKECGGNVFFGCIRKEWFCPPGITIIGQDNWLENCFSMVICNTCLTRAGYKRTNKGFKKMSETWRAKNSK
jgi:hypothetical protein